jgi:hypothetical protein
MCVCVVHKDTTHPQHAPSLTFLGPVSAYRQESFTNKDNSFQKAVSGIIIIRQSSIHTAQNEATSE